MDAVEFLTEKRRMCDASDCCDCALYTSKTKCCFIDKTKEDAEKVVKIVEKWSKDHPKKTRASEFLKVYPNAPVHPANGIPTIVPCALDWTLHKESCFGEGCAECRRKYWTEEVK